MFIRIGQGDEAISLVQRGLMVAPDGPSLGLVNTASDTTATCDQYRIGRINGLERVEGKGPGSSIQLGGPEALKGKVTGHGYSLIPPRMGALAMAFRG